MALVGGRRGRPRPARPARPARHQPSRRTPGGRRAPWSARSSYPGSTACLRCIDAHRSIARPRPRGRHQPLRRARRARPRADGTPDVDRPRARRRWRVAWAVRDVVAHLDGGGPRPGRGRCFWTPSRRAGASRTGPGTPSVDVRWSAHRPGLSGTMGADERAPAQGRRAHGQARRAAPGVRRPHRLGLGKRIGGASAESVLTEVQQRTAEQLFRTLGDLKGGAMKFGQAMSIFEAALPDEIAAPYREQLTRLQDSAPPMPTMTVREILARELGADWKDHLVWFDPEPAAAASIGQVHRGTLGRRPRGGRQGAVPRLRRGADLRPAPAQPGRPRTRAAGARARHPGADRRGAGARRRGARLPARGRGPAQRSPPSSATTPTSWCPTWCRSPAPCWSPSGWRAPARWPG